MTTLNDPATRLGADEPAGLPGPDLVGMTATWSLPGTDGTVIELHADFIGWASSRSNTHWDHPAGTYASVNQRCRSCRWFEPRIFREVRADDDPEPERYLVHSAGMTAVPGERILTRHAWALSADEVLDLLSTQRDKEARAQRCPVCGGNGSSNTPGVPCHACGGKGFVFGPARETHFSVPARRVIAQAAGLDEELAEAKQRRGL